VLIFLINAAYRDGEGGQPALVRIAGSIGAVALVPLVAIACYALMLRIGQYGLTPERIIAFFCAGIAVCFAMGYAISAVNIGGWLKGVEPTNVFAAFLVMAVILSLLTPLADPAQLSVRDQVSRLASGKTMADAFDYEFLRFKSARYGREALAALAAQGVGKEPEKVASLATEAKERTEPWSHGEPRRVTPTELAARITVYPKGSTLPESFLAQDWTDTAFGPDCLKVQELCDAVLIDLDSDNTPEILVFDHAASVFKLTASGTWANIGTLEQSQCENIKPAIESGSYSLTPNRFSDLLVDGRRLRLLPEPQGCMEKPAN
jgi:hypothetical protein